MSYGTVGLIGPVCRTHISIGTNFVSSTCILSVVPAGELDPSTLTNLRRVSTGFHCYNMGCTCSKANSDAVVDEKVPEEETEPPVQQAMTAQVQQQAEALYNQISAAVAGVTGEQGGVKSDDKTSSAGNPTVQVISGAVSALFQDVTEGVGSAEALPKKKKHRKKKRGKGAQAGDASSGGDATPQGSSALFEEPVEEGAANPEAYYSAESEGPGKAMTTDKAQSAEGKKHKKTSSKNN